MGAPRHHLIGTITAKPGESVRNQLEAAYTALARVWLRHWHALSEQAPDMKATTSWRDLAVAVRRSEEPVDVSEAAAHCAAIANRRERPWEVFDTLGHVEVLLAAIDLLEPLGLTPWLCDPSQASTPTRLIDFLYYETGENQITDLQGQDFVLEAYGGVNYANNGKAALDFDSLRLLKEKYPTVRCFVAVRGEALKEWPVGVRKTVKYKHRTMTPWAVTATLIHRWPDNPEAPYLLLELGDFEGGDPARTLEAEFEAEDEDWRRMGIEGFFKDDGDGDAAYDRYDELFGR